MLPKLSPGYFLGVISWQNRDKRFKKCRSLVNHAPYHTANFFGYRFGAHFRQEWQNLTQFQGYTVHLKWILHIFCLANQLFPISKM